jgi:hypothetical protein
VHARPCSWALSIAWLDPEAKSGLSMMDAEIGGKRVQLLRELIPNLSRIAVLATTHDDEPVRPAFRRGPSCSRHKRRPRRRPVCPLSGKSGQTYSGGCGRIGRE